eukprot:Ihof_evm7s158 gene=Ihof_evmTU7s158
MSYPTQPGHSSSGNEGRGQDYTNQGSLPPSEADVASFNRLFGQRCGPKPQPRYNGPYPVYPLPGNMNPMPMPYNQSSPGGHLPNMVVPGCPYPLPHNMHPGAMMVPNPPQVSTPPNLQQESPRQTPELPQRPSSSPSIDSLAPVQLQSPPSNANTFTINNRVGATGTNLMGRDIIINTMPFVKGENGTGREAVKVTTITIYATEVAFYTGHLAAVSLNYIAYPVKLANINEWGIRVLNRTTSNKVLLKGHQVPLTDLAFVNTTSSTLASVDRCGHLMVHQLVEEDGSLVCIKKLSVLGSSTTESPYHRLCWYPLNQSILAVADGLHAEMWNISTIVGDNETVVCKRQDITTGLVRLSGHSKPINSLAFDTDGMLLATASDDGHVMFWDLSSTHGRCLKDLVPHGGLPVTYLAFCVPQQTGGAHYLVTCGGFNTHVGLWDLQDWSCVQRMTFKSQDGQALQLHAGLDPEGQYLVMSGLHNSTVYVFGLGECAEVIGHKSFTTMREFALALPILSFVITDCSLIKGSSGCMGPVGGCMQYSGDEIAGEEDAMQMTMHCVNNTAIQTLALRFPPDVTPSEPKSEPEEPTNDEDDEEEVVDELRETTESVDVNALTDAAGEIHCSPPAPTDQPDSLFNSESVSDLLSLDPLPGTPDGSDAALTSLMLAAYGNTSHDDKDEAESAIGQDSKEASSTSEEEQLLPLDLIEPPSPLRIMSDDLDLMLEEETTRTDDLEPVEAANATTHRYLTPPVVETTNQNDLLAAIKDMIADSEQRMVERTERLLNKQWEKILEEREERERLEKQRTEKIIAVVANTVQETVMGQLEQVVSNSIQATVVPNLAKQLADSMPHLAQNIVDQVALPVQACITTSLEETLVPVFERSSSQVLGRVFANEAAIKSIASAAADALHSPMLGAFNSTIHSVLVPAYEAATKNMCVQIKNSLDMSTADYIRHVKQEVAILGSARSIQGSLSSLEISTSSLQEVNKGRASLEGSVESEKRQTSIGDVVPKSFRRASRNQPAQKLPTSNTATRPVSTSSTSLARENELRKSSSEIQSPMDGNAVEAWQAINRLLIQGDYSNAFVMALRSANQIILDKLCRTVDVVQVLCTQPCPLSQPVLMSLCRQLSVDLSHNSGMKLIILMEAVRRFDLSDMVTRTHLPRILVE